MSKLDHKGRVFYVYTHVNRNGEVVYVGKGSKGRAWDSRPTTRDNVKHCEWMDREILDERPFVKFVASNLLSSQALAIEKTLRDQLKPFFNIY